MPPPTGNCSQPRPAVNVRIRIFVSIAPSNPMKPRLPQYGPRAVGSSSAMISMARTFGAPVTEPPGNAARSRSSGPQSGPQLAADFRHQVMHVAERLDFADPAARARCRTRRRGRGRCGADRRS